MRLRLVFCDLEIQLLESLESDEQSVRQANVEKVKQVVWNTLVVPGEAVSPGIQCHVDNMPRHRVSCRQYNEADQTSRCAQLSEDKC